jgi:hypothetical protein
MRWLRVISAVYAQLSVENINTGDVKTVGFHYPVALPPKNWRQKPMF